MCLHVGVVCVVVCVSSVTIQRRRTHSLQMSAAHIERLIGTVGLIDL